MKWNIFFGLDSDNFPQLGLYPFLYSNIFFFFFLWKILRRVQNKWYFHSRRLPRPIPKTLHLSFFFFSLYFGVSDVSGHALTSLYCLPFPFTFLWNLSIKHLSEDLLRLQNLFSAFGRKLGLERPEKPKIKVKSEIVWKFLIVVSSSAYKNVN